MDPRLGATLWIIRQFSVSQTDAEMLVDRAYDRVRRAYSFDVESTEFGKVFRQAVRNGVKSHLRRLSREGGVKLPPPADPIDRFTEFVLELGVQSRRELMHWHRGLTPQESARYRGIAVDSVKRERRRIVRRWKRFLQGCPDLTESEKRDQSPYLYGEPKLGDIR